MKQSSLTVWLGCLVAVAWLCLCALPATAEDVRTWTAGKYKLQAKFVSLEDDTVTLEKKDGSEVEIPLRKLSKADQEFIAQTLEEAKESPFKSKEADPFKAKKKKSARPRTKADESGNDDSSESAEVREIKADLSAAQVIGLGAPGEAWQVDPPDPGDGFASKPKNVALPKKTSFFEALKGIAVNPAANKAAVGFVLGEPRPTGTTRVVLCDLATGKCSKAATSSGQMSPLALHDDGRQILMRREEFGFGNLDRLEIWTLNGEKAARRLVWTPYEDAQGGDRDVMWAAFIDADRLATSSRGGKVVIWKYPQIEAECTFDTVGGAVPALSPDRTLLAYCTGTDVGLFDIAKQEVIAQQPTPEKLQWPCLNFSPSGKRLACIAFDKVLAWDVPSGKLERTVPASGLNIHSDVVFAFTDESTILANSQFLIDLDNQLKLWTYTGHEQVRGAAGWTFLGVTAGENATGTLIAAQLPHTAAKELLKKALTDPSLFILKAGTAVKLNVTGIADAAQQARVAEGLTARLKAIDCTVDPNAPLELSASVEGPKQREVSYIGSGDYKVQEYIVRVRFIYQGQPAWETSSTNVPGFIVLGRGENIEGYLRAHEKPNYDFFENVELPKFLQKPSTGTGAGNSLTLGQSQVGPSGIK
ncbi:MAG: SHD1 domain-containing protein [Pirellulales bacterium]